MRRARGWCLAAGVLAALLAPAPRVLADGGAATMALAEGLYQEGIALKNQGKLDQACPKLAESHRLDPGSGTALHLADCYERQGRTASAWSMFAEAQVLSQRMGNRPREEEATRRMRQLEPMLSKLFLQPASSDASAGLDVRLDRQPIAPAALASALPVDPGSHTVDVTAPGRQPWSTVVQVEPRPGTTMLQIPRLLQPPAEPPALAGERPSGSTWSGQRTAALIVGGLGVAGVLVGAISGARAASAMDDSRQRCREADPKDLCDVQGQSLRQDADTAATISTIAMVAGGAALAGGVVLFLTAPSGERPRHAEVRQIAIVAGAATDRAGLALRGEW